MSTKNDQPEPPRDGPGAKRPHAILDLHARRVAEEMGPKAPAGQPLSNDGERPSGESEPASGAGPSGLEPVAPRETRPWYSRDRLLFAGTHALAGLAGGAIAVLALGDSPGRVRQIEARLAVVEGSGGVPAAGPELAPRLDKLEAEAAELGQLSEKVAAVEHGAEANRQAAEARVANIEERFERLVSAGADAPAGTQAAAARLKELEAGLGARLKEANEQLKARGRDFEAIETSASRRDGEIAALASATTELERRLETDRTGIAALRQSLQAIEARVGDLGVKVDGASASVAKELSAAVKPADVAALTAPISKSLAELSERVRGLDDADAARRETLRRLVLALDLAKLRRAIEDNEPYARELDAIRAASGGAIDLAALERHGGARLASLAELEREFGPVSDAILDAGSHRESESVIDRLLGGAASVVRVRRLDYPPTDSSTEAIVGRMETALRNGDLESVIAEAATLPPAAAVPAGTWLGRVEARYAVDRAFAKLESDVGASFGREAGAGK